MAKLLRRLNDACQKNNATLMFAHHTSGVHPYGATPKLSWLAFSGFKQFVRQWWLFNRMEEYEPGSGIHRLKFVAVARPVTTGYGSSRSMKAVVMTLAEAMGSCHQVSR